MFDHGSYAAEDVSAGLPQVFSAGGVSDPSQEPPCQPDEGWDPALTCYAPVAGFRRRGGGFTRDGRQGLSPMEVPCGQCIGCRLARAREWSTRLHHEAQLHTHSSFLTLTYSDECLPLDGSVSVKVLQDFMKRLRKRVGKVRFFACGEYGGLNWRAHYHVLLFGWDFSADRVLWRSTSHGFPVWRSPSLESLWPFGFSEIGSVTAQSAGYVARYVVKKVNGDRAGSHYLRPHPVTGELVQLRPEFVVMSRKPGIGRLWFDEFMPEVIVHDACVVEGKKRPVPRYYDKNLPEWSRELLKQERRKRASLHREDQTPERLAVREECESRRVVALRRSLEDGT